MAAAIRARVTLFGWYLLQAPVVISDQFDSKSAYQPWAFLNSQVLQTPISLRHLNYQQKGQSQHPAWKNRVEIFALSLTLSLQRFSPPTLCRTDPFILIDL